MLGKRAIALALMASFAASAAHARSPASDCARLVRALAQSAATATPLMASPQRSFKSLFDECDQHDTYNGRALPPFQGNPESCKTDPNRAQAINLLGNGALHIRSKAAVDADGAPVSCGANSSHTDQCQTWLRYDQGPEQYVNAEQVPYIVIPSDAPEAGHSFEQASKIRAGDLAIVIYKQRCVYSIVADSGPYFRIGEASIAVHNTLGNRQCEKNEKPCTRLRAKGLGVGIPSEVDYLIFPGSRPANLSASNVQRKIQQGNQILLKQFLQ
jgi:Fungal chitosanase of glycosyl hydrolase group 75